MPAMFSSNVRQFVLTYRNRQITTHEKLRGKSRFDLYNEMTGSVIRSVCSLASKKPKLALWGQEAPALFATRRFMDTLEWRDNQEDQSEITPDDREMVEAAEYGLLALCALLLDKPKPKRGRITYQLEDLIKETGGVISSIDNGDYVEVKIGWDGPETNND